NHIVCYDPLLKTTVDVTASRILWDGDIKAVVVTAAPHRLNFEEEQGLEKIERMYAQSLVTVFDECIIANLTADYYVNCQKDMMWTSIPEQGSFGKENYRYAKAVM
ncbi:hybrid sensor histidine kinase/response regulator, partial [Romboutsia ilealis]|nr:hybrid sensor histidine kinase/response regulator [Romboutsia ilealis]